MLTVLIRTEYLYQTVSYAIAFISQSILLIQVFKWSLNKNLAANLLVNIGCCVLMSASGFAHCTYMLIVGSETGPYLASIVFWIGNTFQSFSVCLSISVSFLLVDRIAVLRKPIHCVQTRKRFTILTVVLISVIGVFLSATNWFYEFPIPEYTAFECPTQACLMVKSSFLLISLPKGIFGLWNVILALTFWHHLDAHQNNFIGTRQNFRQANIIAVIAVGTEVLLNFIPVVVWNTLAYFGLDHWNYAGPWALVLYSTDSALTALIYRKVIAKKSSSRKCGSAISIPHSELANMSDLNELVSLKAVQWSYQLAFVKPLRFINEIAVYCLCPLSNFILLYFIVFRSPLVVRRSYRSILIVCTLVDIASTLTNIWCLMYARYIDTRTIYFLEGAVSSLPLSLQWISVSLMFGVRLSESTILVVEFYFRHYIIKHRRTLSPVVLSAMIGLAVVVALGISVMIMFDCCILYLMQAGNFEALKAVHSGPILFDDTNTIIPTLTTVFPLTGKFAFKLLGVDTWSLNEMTTTFYVWLPFINSISTLLIISCYRRLLFQAIKRAFSHRSTSIHFISRLTT